MRRVEITGCDDFLTQECKHAVVFKVKDARDFHAKQEYFGQHYVWVYGELHRRFKSICKINGNGSCFSLIGEKR